MKSFSMFNYSDEDITIKLLPRTPESSILIETPHVNGTVVSNETDRSVSMCLSPYEPFNRTSSLTLYFEDLEEYREILFLVDGYPFWFRGRLNFSLFRAQYINGCEVYISESYVRIYSYENYAQDVRVIPFKSSPFRPEHDETDSYVYDPLTNITIATLGGNSGAYY